MLLEEFVVLGKIILVIGINCKIMEVGEFYKCDSWSNTGLSIVAEYLGDQRHHWNIEEGYIYYPTFKIVMSNSFGHYYAPGKIIYSIKEDNWIKL
jgi:hypothetical protein